MLSAKNLFQEILDNDESYRLFCSIAASGESQGGWENARIAALVPAGERDLAPRIARHGADEDKHGRIFNALMRKRGLEPVEVPADTDYTMLLERHGIGLAHEQLKGDRPLTVQDVVTYLAHSRVTEQRASEQMNLLRKHFADHPDLGRAVKMISNDEDNHLAYCHEELLRFAHMRPRPRDPADPADLRARRDPRLPGREPRRDGPHGTHPRLVPRQGGRPRRGHPRRVRVRACRGLAPDGLAGDAGAARRPRRPRHHRTRVRLTAAGRPYSQPRRLNCRYSRTSSTTMIPTTAGYDHTQCSSGMWSKFMP